jgi:hypothetical protein
MSETTMSASKGRELTWSILHVGHIDPDYVGRVLEAAPRYGVESIEVCGGCHGGLQGLEGGIFYRDYPEIRFRLDAEAIAENIAALRAIGSLCHARGKPLYYWHREVCAPPGLIDVVPGLLDANGEFDLLGADYGLLLEQKLEEFFANVTEIDGIVLTLTEADYSVVHNSRPDLYPPAQVVRRLVEIFARVHKRLGRRFILRSFGSIEQDHVDLFAGALEASREWEVEMETKVTPFDWHPFLPLNPWLRPMPPLRAGVEFDGMGEYYGPGVISSPCPDLVIKQFQYALAQGAERFAIRIDRHNYSALGTLQEVNLAAASMVLQDPEVTAEEVWHKWGRERWGEHCEELVEIFKQSMDVVKKSRYIDGNLIFHTFVISPSMEHLKVGGIFAVFTQQVPLSSQADMWSMLSSRATPSRKALLAEKAEAVGIARGMLADFQRIEAGIPEEERGILRTDLDRHITVARLFEELCAAICAYFDAMETGGDERAKFLSRMEAALTFCDSVEDDLVRETHSIAMAALLAALAQEFAAEADARRDWKMDSRVVDFVVCGGLLDEHRVRRYLHGSGTCLIGGRPARAIGNPVFPNGFLEYEMKVPEAGGVLKIQTAQALVSTGNREGKGIKQGALEVGTSQGRPEFLNVSLDGEARIVPVPANGLIELPLGHSNKEKPVRVRIAKHGAHYPWVHGLAVTRR